MGTVTVNRKPCKCPKCGGKVVPIIWGEPTAEAMQQAERKEIILGGCLISMGGNPQWGCLECETQFIKK